MQLPEQPPVVEQSIQIQRSHEANNRLLQNFNSPKINGEQALEDISTLVSAGVTKKAAGKKYFSYLRENFKRRSELQLAVWQPLSERIAQNAGDLRFAQKGNYLMLLSQTQQRLINDVRMIYLLGIDQHRSAKLYLDYLKDEYQVPIGQIKNELLAQPNKRKLLVGVAATAAAVSLSKIGLPSLENPPQPSQPSTKIQTEAQTKPIFIQPPKPVTEQPKRTELPKRVVLGTFETDKRNPKAGNPDIYILGTDTKVKLPNNIGEFEIRGYGTRLRYKIFIPATNQFFEVPIDQVKIIQGEPLLEAEIAPNNFIGIRADQPELIKEAKKMGASKVRINLQGCQLERDDSFSLGCKSAIKEAINNKMEIILVFHPDRPLPRAEMLERLEYLFSDWVVDGYKNITLELGNEPDNGHIPFWENRNLGTFTEFIKQAAEVIRVDLKREDIKLIIGALVNQDNTDSLLNELSQKGVNLKGFALAVHAYQDVSDLETRLSKVKVSLQKRELKMPIWVTELGVANYDKNALVPMLNFATSTPEIQAVLLHELPDHEDNFGFINPQTRQYYPSYYLIQRYSQLYRATN